MTTQHKKNILQTFRNWFALKIALWHKEKQLFFKEKELWCGGALWALIWARRFYTGS